MELAPDTVVADRFRLNHVIGKGGMGSVWKATHLGLDIPCAVKFIEGTYATLPEAQARFEREAKAAAQLRSPHVVQILDHGVWQGTPYLAMELLDGEDLGQRLKRVGVLSPKETCVVIGQVSRALTKAHAAGIVHRDLKPDNIFLVRDDDREIAKVLDFGIAKSAGGVIDGSATKTGAMLGTPYYMSPEQAQGTKAVDHRSDLWSLGVIVFQVITGVLPFESNALGDLIMRIMVGVIPVPSTVVPNLPPSFDAWWAKASNRDPAQRFQSAKELTDALVAAFAGHNTDVLSASQMRGILGSDASMQAALPQMTPQPGAQGFGGTPRPMTPHPGAQTPYPVPHTQLVPAHSTTGSPTARTYGANPPVPKAKTGLYVGLFGGFVGIVALVGVAITAVSHSQAAHSAAASSSAVALPAPLPSPAAPNPSPAPTVAPPTQDTVATTTSAPPQNPPSTVPAYPGIGRSHVAPPPKPATPPPSSKKAPSSSDLGI